MANIRAFVSSTCYDLSVVRGQLRSFIESFGFEPVMSDFSDVVYDPRTHTHTSCIDEVASCDLVIVLIGSRFGGTVVPQAATRVNLEELSSASGSAEILKSCENLSITQLEVLRAVEISIPVFAFVDERVLHDHATYEKNKLKSIINEIEFSSIDKPKTAGYIFEFINFLRHRSVNNSIHSYGKYQDIELTLRRQWSGLFQRLLSEQRKKASDYRRMDALTEQFEDLKAAILTAIGNKNERAVARGVVKYRKFLDFIRAVMKGKYTFLLSETHSWEEFLEHIGVEEVRVPEGAGERVSTSRATCYLIKEDRRFIELRMPFDILELGADWNSFVQMAPEVRQVIHEALEEMSTTHVIFRYVRHHEETIEQYLEERASEALRPRRGLLEEPISE